MLFRLETTFYTSHLHTGNCSGVSRQCGRNIEAYSCLICNLLVGSGPNIFINKS